MSIVLRCVWLFTILPAFCFSQATDSAVVAAKAARTDRLKPVGFIIPSVFIGYGIISLAGNNEIRRLDYTTNNELQEDHPTFALKVDNISRYVPAVAVYGLDFAGIRARHNFTDRSAMLLMSMLIAQGSVGGIKSWAHRMRPNGSNDDSFPSGHTSFAFMSAEFLYQEYKDQSPWYGAAGYVIATGTGILRLYNNAHWVSDVVAGAGAGILSTKISYLIYPYLKRKLFSGKPVNVMFSPGYQNGNLTFNFVKQF